MLSGINVVPFTGTVVMDKISVITGALVRLTALRAARKVGPGL